MNLKNILILKSCVNWKGVHLDTIKSLAVLFIKYRQTHQIICSLLRKSLCIDHRLIMRSKIYCDTRNPVLSLKSLISKWLFTFSDEYYQVVDSPVSTFLRMTIAFQGIIAWVLPMIVSLKLSYISKRVLDFYN